MQSSQLISILIPVYNVEKYLKICLETVINQSYKNLEILLLNDGSTDASLRIIEEYSKKDKRVKYISRENRGLLPTRLELVEMCSGEAFAFIDSDDWVDLDYIEKMVNTMNLYKSDMVRCGDIIEYNDCRRSKKYCKASKNEMIVIERDKNFDQFIIDLMTTYYYNSIHSVLINRRILLSETIEEIRNNQGVYIGEDVIFNCALYRKAQIIITIPECLYHYRKNPDSMTNSIMTIETYKKRIADCFIVRNDIKSLGILSYNMEGLWNDAILHEMDECTNDLIKRCSDKKTINNCIEFLQKFLKEKNISESEQYRYMFDNNAATYEVLKVLHRKKLEQKLKRFIKSILYFKLYKN